MTIYFKGRCKHFKFHDSKYCINLMKLLGTIISKQFLYLPGTIWNTRKLFLSDEMKKSIVKANYAALPVLLKNQKHGRNRSFHALVTRFYSFFSIDQHTTASTTIKIKRFFTTQINH